MPEGRRNLIIAAVGLGILLTGCWDSHRDRSGGLAFPFTDLAIDPSDCACTAEKSATEPTLISGSCEVLKDHPGLQLDSCNTVYASTDGGGVFKTTDAGATWGPLFIPSEIYVSSLAVDPHPSAHFPRVVYAGTEDGGVFRSLNGGLNWIPQTGFLPIPSVRKVVVDARTCVGDPPCLELYAASQVGGVWKSEDQGRNWRQMTTDGLVEQNVSSLALSPKGISTRVYAGTEGGHVFKFEAGKWTEEGTDINPLPEEVIALAVHPTAANTIYAGLSGGEGGRGAGGIHRTNDGGVLWEKVSTPGPADSVFELAFVLPPNAVSPNQVVLYAGVSGLSVCSVTTCAALTDWESIDVGRKGGISAFAIDPYTHTTLYVGTFLGELFQSIDGGKSWTQRTLEF